MSSEKEFALVTPDMLCALHTCEEQSDSIEKQSGATIHSGTENSPNADDIAQITADDAAGDVIAIVGIGAKVPGADNIREFWRLLQNGENHITDVPASRWNADAFYDKDPTKPGKAVAKQGGFVKDAEKFDNAFFEINDYEAASLDPQQSFVLECTHMALEDAGLTRSHISGSKTGVFIGAMTADHATLFPAWSPELDSYVATGVCSSLLSARVSYVYNLLGPSMVIDTACSSSLVAIHQGIQAIRNGDCDMAICGGVNYMGAPDLFVQLSKTKMLSPTGQSQAFSANADGYARGEGCGVVILKRLKDALQNSDRIWATIVSGVNQDGHTVTPVTSPSGIQQMALLREIYTKFNIDVSKLDYIEAHGTGTQAGDPVEVNAIGNFLKEWGEPRERYIGSVKTNIGHLEPASGVTAVVKVLLMMKHNAIVPSLLCDKVNPLIGLKNFGFVIPTSLVKWESKEKMACCTSFGIGGTNSHVVLQAFHQEQRLTPEKGCPVVVCFSGKTKLSLIRSLKEVQEIEGMWSRDADRHDLTEESLLTSIAYTSSVRREHHIFRKAVVVDRMQDLFHSVSQCLSEDLTLTPSKNPRVIYVFCGMGTTRPGMLMQMMEAFPVFKEVMMNIDAILSQIDREESWSLVDRLSAQGSIVDPVLSPLAIFACQVALAALWKSLGINPDCVVGQSIGEVAAAYTAGCFSLETAVKIMFCRSKILADAVGGKMTVVKNLSVETVRDILREFENASIALEYSPLSCGVSADADTMTKVHQKLTRFSSGEQIVQLIPLDVPVAYHSHFVDPCKVHLAAGLSDLESTPPKISYISAVSGEKLTTAPGQSYWVNHLREPVLFHQAVTAAWKDKSNRTVFVEIGPKQVLKAHIQDIFPSETVPVIGSMFKEPEQKVFLQAVASLHELGADVFWKTLYNGRHSVYDIPRYVFDKKTCLKRTTAQALHPSGTEVVNHHLFLYPVVSSSGFKIVLSTLTTPFLYDHVVGHAVTVPGALYAEAGLAIAKQSRESITQQPVVSAIFISPLTATKDELIELSVTPDKDATTESLNFSVKKQNHDIARLHVDWRTASHSEPSAVNLQYIRDKCIRYVSKQEIYSSLRTEGFQYGYTFALLENAYTREGESLAFMKVIPEVIKELTTTTIHPCVLDSMFQSVMFTSSARDTGDLQLLQQSVKQLKVFRSMETDMFVHSRLLHDEGRRTSFQLTLLSTDGRVLATVDEFVVARLDVENRSGLPMLMSMDWIRVCQVWDKNNPEVEEALVLATRPVPKTDNGKDVKYLKPVNHAMDWDEINQDVTPLMEGANQTTAVVVVCDLGLTKDSTGDELEVEILNTCGFIHSILKLARDVNLVKPIYICTLGAWPASDKSFQMTALNPAATAVWGMVRTAVIENIYPCVAMVDIHMPANLLTANFFSLAAQQISSSQELKNKSEILITAEFIYVNRVHRVDQHVRLPSVRDAVFHAEENYLVVSEEAEAVAAPEAVKVRFAVVPGGHYITVKPNVFGLPSPHLTRQVLVHEQSEAGSSRHSVIALETLAQLEKERDALTIVCCPTPVGSRVSVPADTSMPASLMPDYHLGDLTKLVLLFSLAEKASANDVTIVTSNAHVGLSATLKMILETRDNNNKTFTVTVQESKTVTSTVIHSQTVISFILLDSDVTGTLASQWAHAKCLITCSALMTPEALTCLTFRLPDCDVCLVDTQLVYRPRTLRQLVPKVKAWLSKLEKNAVSTLAELMHMSIKGDFPQCFLRDDKLSRMLEFRELNLSNIPAKTDRQNLFSPNSVYIVVGGLTGLGWVCVKFLATHGARNIAIIQRRTPSPENRSHIQQVCSQSQCVVRAFQADVTSLNATESALRSIRDSFENSPLKGVFFGAVVIDDGPFLSMNRDKFDRVLAPKVKGAWNFHLLTRHLPLDFFVMHSSMVSVIGNQGQANYSTANAFLDGLAYYRQSLGLAAQSFSWGPLATGLLSNNKTGQQKLESFGFSLMSESGIYDSLCPLLMLNWPHCVPVRLNEKQFLERVSGSNALSLLVRFQAASESYTESGACNPPVDVSAARSKDSSTRLEIYSAYVRLLASRVLSVDQGLVTPDTNLVDLGLDSVSSMILIDQIFKDTSVRLPAILSGEVTVRTVSEVINDHIESLCRE